jgi:hypothetical protein
VIVQKDVTTHVTSELEVVRCNLAFSFQMQWCLYVLALKPSFKKRPLELETYAAEGGNITIICNPEAAPRPKFVWKKDGNVIGE